MIDALEIGYAIKKRRAELGLTQAQVADAAGVSKRCLWSLELGQNPGVQLDKLIAVFDALGLDLQIAKRCSAKSQRLAQEQETTIAPHASHTPASTKARQCKDHAGDVSDILAILRGEA